MSAQLFPSHPRSALRVDISGPFNSREALVERSEVLPIGASCYILALLLYLSLWILPENIDKPSSESF